MSEDHRTVRALVAGVGDFPVPDDAADEEERADGLAAFTPLPAVREAVRALAFALDRTGAKTGGDPLLECTRPEFTRAWEELRGSTADGDPLLVHFAGHGTQPSDGGALYLAAAGGKPRDDLLDRTCLSVETLLRTARNSGRPVLFLLDVCGAGQAVAQQQLALLAERRRHDRLPNVWIIGACAADAITYGARFTAATTHVLHQLADGDLDVSPTLPYVPLETLAAAIDRQLARTDRLAGRPGQSVVRTPHPYADPAPQPFFANPARTADPGGGLLTGMNPWLRELALACVPGLDPLHFATSAAGNPSAVAVLFSGRRSHLERIRHWTANADGEQGRLLVVTGGPGSGKSALLGVTTCRLHPDLETLGLQVRAVVPDFEPRIPSIVLAVHARQLTLPQIADSLHRQLRRQTGRPEEDPAAADQDATAALLDDLRTTDDVLVILDALDEATDPAGVLNGLLLPLAGAAPADTPDAPASCRVMIGTRPWWDTLPRLHAHLAAHPAAALSLDPVTTADRRVLADDLNSYLGKLLPPRTYPSRRVRSIADQLASYSDHGAFLVAALYADHLRTTPEREPPGPPRDITAVFDLHVDTLARTEPWIRPVLDILGRARGHGLPLDLIHTAALAHRPPDPDRPTPQLADTRRALGKAAFYLRTTPDSDHRLLYRYFHQALTDHTQRRTDPAVLHQALTATIPAPPHGSPDWQHARPALLRHVADHATAVDGTALDQLLADPGYLVHAEPDHLVPYLGRAKGERAVALAEIYRSTTAYDPRRGSAQARRGLLALDAAARQRPDLAEAFARTPVPGSDIAPIPRWATRGFESGYWDVGRLEHDRAIEVALGQGLDGTPIAVRASGFRAPEVWDLATGTRLRTLAGRNYLEKVIVAAAPDGTPLAAAAAAGGAIQVWDLTTGAHRYTLEGHSWHETTELKAVRSPDGTALLVTAGGWAKTRVWDLATGTLRHTLDITGYQVSGIATAVSRDGRPLAVICSRDNTTVVWDLATGTRLHTLGHRRSGTLDVFTVQAPDGASLAVTSDRNRTARLWDVTTGKRLRTLKRHDHVLWRSATTATPDGMLLLVSASKNTAVVWDLNTGARLHTLAGHTSWVTTVAATTGPDGTPLAVTGSDDRMAIVWNLATGARLHTIAGDTGKVRSVAAARGRGGTPLGVTTSSDGTAAAWNLTTGTITSLLGGRAATRALAAANGPNGIQFLVTASQDGTAAVWNATTRARIRNLKGHTDHLTALAATTVQGVPYLVTASADRTAMVWDLTTGARLHTLAGHSAEVTSVASGIGPGGVPIAVTADEDRMAAVWDLTTGAQLHTLTGHSAGFTSVAVVEGRGGVPLAVTGSGDNTAGVWDLTTGARLHTLAGHSAGVTSVAAVKGGSGVPLAVTGSGDSTAVVWDLTTGMQLHTLAGHSAEVTSVTAGVGPDRVQIAVTTSEDRTAVVWSLVTGALMHRCHLPFRVGRVALDATGFVLSYGTEIAHLDWS